MVEEILTIVRSSSAPLEETSTLVRDMHRVAKFGPTPMERGLCLPIDLPLDEIRTAVNSVLGDDHNVPITLSCNDECELIVQLHVFGPDDSENRSVWEHMAELGQALLGIDGVAGVSFPGDGDPHMPPVYREWAEAVKRNISAKRTAMGISIEDT